MTNNIDAPPANNTANASDELEFDIVFLLYLIKNWALSKKLLYCLYNLYIKGQLSDRFAVVGVARRLKNDAELREWVKDSILTYGESENEKDINAFTSHFYYQSHDVTDSASYKQLKTLVDRLDKEYELGGNRIFYLAMSPEFFGTVAEHLKEDGLTDTNGFKRLVIEKPFGHDLQSAIKLNNQIRKAFDEDEKLLRKVCTAHREGCNDCILRCPYYRRGYDKVKRRYERMKKRHENE